MAECVFCEILAGRAPVSMIYEDDEVAAFMSLYPSRPGECLVIPKEHIDCFTDVEMTRPHTSWLLRSASAGACAKYSSRCGSAWSSTVSACLMRISF